jgi:hypothetical protein
VAQKYTYTHDRALDTFFVKDAESEKILLKTHNEIVAVTFIHDLLTGNIDPDKLTETLDMTER